MASESESALLFYGLVMLSSTSMRLASQLTLVLNHFDVCFLRGLISKLNPYTSSAPAPRLLLLYNSNCPPLAIQPPPVFVVGVKIVWKTYRVKLEKFSTPTRNWFYYKVVSIGSPPDPLILILKGQNGEWAVSAGGLRRRGEGCSEPLPAPSVRLDQHYFTGEVSLFFD